MKREGIELRRTETIPEEMKQGLLTFSFNEHHRRMANKLLSLTENHQEVHDHRRANEFLHLLQYVASGNPDPEETREILSGIRILIDRTIRKEKTDIGHMFRPQTLSKTLRGRFGKSRLNAIMEQLLRIAVSSGIQTSNRLLSLYLLGEIGVDATKHGETMSHIANHYSESVRVAVLSLKAPSSTSVIEPLTKAVDNEALHQVARCMALEGLAQANQVPPANEHVKTLLLDSLSGEPELIYRSSRMRLLSYLSGSNSGKEVLLHMLDKSSKMSAEHTADIIRKLGRYTSRDSSGWKKLERVASQIAATNPNKEIQHAYYKRVVNKLPSERREKKIKQLLRSGNNQRIKIGLSLITINRSGYKYLNDFHSLIEAKGKDIRREIYGGLFLFDQIDQIKSKDVLKELLRDGLKDPSQDVRGLALNALRMFVVKDFINAESYVSLIRSFLQKSKPIDEQVKAILIVRHMSNEDLGISEEEMPDSTDDPFWNQHINQLRKKALEWIDENIDGSR